jgi:hypothetical protein
MFEMRSVCSRSCSIQRPLTYSYEFLGTRNMFGKFSDTKVSTVLAPYSVVIFYHHMQIDSFKLGPCIDEWRLKVEIVGGAHKFNPDSPRYQTKRNLLMQT